MDFPLSVGIRPLRSKRGAGPRWHGAWVAALMTGRARAILTAAAVMVLACLGAGPAGAASGFLSTRGSQIVDASGRSVRINAIGWFGENLRDQNTPGADHLRGIR